MRRLQAYTHVVYDSAWQAMPSDKKAALLDLLAANRTDVVIIATPATSPAQLNAVLTEAAGGTPIGVGKGPQLPAGTASSLVAGVSAYHAPLLPALLGVHDANTLAFAASGIVGGGVVVARSTSSSDPTAVQWTLPGDRVVTLLGYWAPGACCRLVAASGAVECRCWAPCVGTATQISIFGPDAVHLACDLHCAFNVAAVYTLLALMSF